jgi:crotonobetainyl-CoA:carnitine CoA-transferase CaiB-like acyl-CoA transferase
MTFSRPLPLADLRVVAVEQYGAGPFGSLQLADLGAEVIKIEDPTIGGDVSRSIPPYADGEGNSLFFESFNRNKKSVAIDLRQPHDRAAFEDLVRVSDAVFCNLRGDTAARLRLREADRVDITTELEHAFVKRKTDEWLVDLRAAGIPAGAINDVAAALEDPQAQAREVISEFTHPHLGTVRQLKSPLRLDDGRAAIERGPFLGEHTAQLLSELCDYDTSMLDQLAIRSHAPDRTTNAPALTSPDKCELVNRASSSSCPRERQ